MKRHIRKLHGHMRRLGHSLGKSMEDSVGSLRRIAKDNPELTAVATGAGVAGVAAGLGVPTAMLLGGAAGLGAQKLTK